MVSPLQLKSEANISPSFQLQQYLAAFGEKFTLTTQWKEFLALTNQKGFLISLAMKRNFEPSLSLKVKGLKVNTPIQLKMIFYDQIHHHLIYWRIFASSNLSRMHYLRGLVVVFGFPWLCPGLEFASMNLNLTGDRSQSAPFNPCIEICTAAEYNWILTFGNSWFRHLRHLFCFRRQTWRSRICRSPTSGRRPSTSQTLSWLLASASFTGSCCFQSFC